MSSHSESFCMYPSGSIWSFTVKPQNNPYKHSSSKLYSKLDYANRQLPSLQGKSIVRRVPEAGTATLRRKPLNCTLQTQSSAVPPTVAAMPPQLQLVTQQSARRVTEEARCAQASLLPLTSPLPLLCSWQSQNITHLRSKIQGCTELQTRPLMSASLSTGVLGFSGLHNSQGSLPVCSLQLHLQTYTRMINTLWYLKTCLLICNT